MRVVAFVAASLMLCGCSSDLFSFGDSDAAPEGVAAEQPVVAVAKVVPNDAFCRSVAAQDAQDHGYDQPTQIKVATQSYQQCMTIYGTSAR